MTNEHDSKQPVKISEGVAFICVAKHHSPRQRLYECEITAHPRKLRHSNYYLIEKYHSGYSSALLEVHLVTS